MQVLVCNLSSDDDTIHESCRLCCVKTVEERTPKIYIHMYYTFEIYSADKKYIGGSISATKVHEMRNLQSPELRICEICIYVCVYVPIHKV